MGSNPAGRADFSFFLSFLPFFLPSDLHTPPFCQSTRRGIGSETTDNLYEDNPVRNAYCSSAYPNYCLSDPPSRNNTSILCKEKETYFTAVLELGDMFYGGGVPIDHYIIQVEDGTQLETPGPTYSFDIMYNTSLSVNISAHNCSGYSDPFPLVLQYDDEG